MSKTCNKCLREKPFEDFHKTNQRADGRRDSCRTCHNAYEVNRYKIGGYVTSDLWVLKNKDTIRAKSKKWRQENAEHIRATQATYRLKNIEKLNTLNMLRTGFTPQFLEKTLNFQNNTCAICKKDFKNAPEKHIHKDHCHKSGEPRGVLCHGCNTGLGAFADRADLLRIAADYLENTICDQLPGRVPKRLKVGDRVRKTNSEFEGVVSEITLIGIRVRWTSGPVRLRKEQLCAACDLEIIIKSQR